jgi:taurine dioxygenase
VSFPPKVPVITIVKASKSSLDVPEIAKSIARKGGIAHIPGLDLTYDSLPLYCRAFGPTYIPRALPPGLDLNVVTNVGGNLNTSRATNWHFDQSFVEVPPDWSVLYCPSNSFEIDTSNVPTVFSDSAKLLTYLSDGLVANLRALFVEHRAHYPEDGDGITQAQALHSAIGQVEGPAEALFAAPATVDRFLNWTKEESQLLLGYLFRMLNWPELSVRHDWSAGDLLVWPNRRYPHRVLPHTPGTARPLWRVLGHWEN